MVTVTPAEIDLEALELGFVSSIQLNITNHGLIRANDATIELPNNHPFLEFSVPLKEPGYLDPLSSTIVTVHISNKNVQKRAIPIALLYAGKLLYNYICGTLQVRLIPIVFKRQTAIASRRINSFTSSGGVIFSGFSSSTKSLCNKCVQAILTCLPNPKFPFAGCIPLALGGSTPTKSVIDALKWIQCTDIIPKHEALLKNILRAGLCGYGLIKDCVLPLLSNDKRDVDTIIRDLLRPLFAINQSMDAAIEILGDERWLFVEDENWVTDIVQPALDDNSEAGVLISTTELSIILAAPPPNGTTIEMVTIIIE